MQIALDYDNCYTRDPEGWDFFIDMMRGRGHDTRIVTSRDDRFDRTQPLVNLEAKMEVIYCRGMAKQPYCRMFIEGFDPDIYIDDKPDTVHNNSRFSPENLAKWREERDH